MAKNYNDIYTAVYTKNNKMDFGNSMIRGNGIPLDITEVYNSYAAAEAYVNSNPVAYEGQILAVTENNDTTVYVIAARLAADNTTVEHYLKPVGSVPDVDGKTIVINDEGKLEAVIPEFVDNDTTYALVTKEVEGGIELTFASSVEDEEDVVFFIPDAYDDSELVARVNNLEEKASAKAEQSYVNEELAKKADKATTLEGYGITDAYTKTETDTKIGEAVAAADHLKRIILDAPGEGEDEENVINAWLNENDAQDIADEFIYMLPTGLQESDNKYREYIVIFDGENKYIEQVGNWEVDLGDYLKSTDAENIYATKSEVTEEFKNYVTSETLSTTLENYATSDDLTTSLGDYTTSEDLATTLEDYAKLTDLPTDYVSDEEIKAYDTAEVASGKYAAKEVTEQGLADRYTKEEVDDLLADKVDNSIATAENGLRFINQTEINKLSKLNLDGEDITISGSVNASQVKELYPTVINIIKGAASDLDPEAEGEQLGLGIEEGAQVNFINNINTNIFSVDSDKKLDLVKVPVGKLDGLASWIEENRDVVTGLYPTAAATLLNTLDNIINNEETGLIAGLTAVKAKALTNENSIKEHADRLDALEYAMAWHELEQNNI